MNLYPITIVENFYDNPDAIRKFALNQKYKLRSEVSDVGYVYPGGRTKDLSILNKSMYERISQKVNAILHNKYDHMRWLITTSFQSVSEDYGRGVIHTDHNNIFAAVVYLSPNAPLDAGTSIYKPNEKFNQSKYESILLENDRRFHNGEKIMDTSYHEMFDEVVRLNNVYNTLILYEGSQYHSANSFFGKTLEDSRLAQVFFVNKIDAQTYDSFPIKRAEAIKV